MTAPRSTAGGHRRRLQLAERRSCGALPLRIAVIAICLALVAAHAGPAHQLLPAARWTSPRTAGGRSCFNPFDLVQWTLSELRADPGLARGSRRLLQQPHRDHPVDGHPHHGRGVRGLRLRVGAVPVPADPVHPGRGGLLVVPLQMSLIPVLQHVQRRWASTARSWASGWRTPAFGLPLAIFLLYNFMSQLPGDLFETASIDGATHFQMFTKVVLPLSVPALGGVRDLPVPVGLERPARGPRVPGRGAGRESC